MTTRATVLATLVAAFTSPLLADAFVAQPSAVRPTTTALHQSSKTPPLPVATGWDVFISLPESMDRPTGEEQRVFRRTVYSHDDWKKHRGQDRFYYYLLAMIKAGVYKNLDREVFFCTTIATLVVLYNALATGYVDLEGVQQAAVFEGLSKIGIPLTAFTLTSPSLGLLLVFRTNTGYKRWDEARKNWGMNINHTRDLVRLANVYYDSSDVTPEQRQDDLNHVALCTWSFVRAMKRHLSPVEEDEEAFVEELYEKLPEKQAEMIVQAAHRPNRALQDLSNSIEDCPMHFIRKNEIHMAVTIFEDNLGSSERLLTSPVPLVYTRHLSRFLAIWLFLLPFGLYDTFAGTWNHIGLIPATVLISVFLLGIEELGTSLEEPFTILPMQAFCDKIYNWCMEIASWSPGDNGRPMKPVKPEHKFFTEQVMAPPAAASPAAPPAAAASYASPLPPPAASAPAPNGALSFAEFLKQQGQGTD